MTTSLTCYAITTNSTTLSTARKMISTSGGSIGTGVTTKVGQSTGWGEIYSQGNTAAWAAASSIGSPTGHGWLFDVSTLQGNKLDSGSYVFDFTFQVSTSLIIGTITYRAYIYNTSNSSYTSICSGTSSSQNISSSASTAVSVTVSSVAATSGFTSTQYLYMDIWCDITTSDTFSSTATLSYFPSNSTTAGYSAASLQTPGFDSNGGTSTKSTQVRTKVATKVTKSSVIRTILASKKTLSTAIRSLIRTTKTISSQLRIGVGPPANAYNSYKNTILGDSPAAYYRLDESSGSIAHDSSGNGYHATLSGTFTLSQSSLIAGDTNASVLLNGITGLLSLPYNLNPSTWSSLTLEFWMKISSGPLHVVVTVDSSSTTLYLNGQPFTGPNSGDAILIETDLYFGGSYSNATLDEVALYQNSKLTPLQIRTHYYAGLALSKSVQIRLPIQTRVTKSSVLRTIVAATSTQKTVFVSLRTSIRTSVIKSILLRTIIRSQVTKSTLIRNVIRTLTTRSVSVRLPVRTQVTRSLPLRVVIRGKVLITSLRVILRTQSTRSLPIRLAIQSLITRSAKLRVVARTLRTSTTVLRVITSTSGTIVTLSTKIRLRLRSLHTLTNPLRITLRSLLSRTTPLRVPIGTKVTKPVLSRVIIRTQTTTTARTRLIIRALHTVSFSLRATIRGITKVAPIRVVLRPFLSKLISLRLSIATRRTLTTALRFCLRSLMTRVSRVRVVVNTTRSMTSTLRVIVILRVTKSLSMRMRIQAQNTKNVSLRLIIQTPYIQPSVVPSIPTFPSSFGLSSCFPLTVPSFSFIMNGITLDPPSIVTAPLLQGEHVLYGQSFTLLWISPSTTTQNVMASGSLGIMTFAVHTGASISAPVQINSIMSGIVFIVTVTIAATTPIEKRIVVTQFY